MSVAPSMTPGLSSGLGAVLDGISAALRSIAEAINQVRLWEEAVDEALDVGGIDAAVEIDVAAAARRFANSPSVCRAAARTAAPRTVRHRRQRARRPRLGPNKMPTA